MLPLPFHPDVRRYAHLAVRALDTAVRRLLADHPSTVLEEYSERGVGARPLQSEKLDALLDVFFSGGARAGGVVLSEYTQRVVDSLPPLWTDDDIDVDGEERFEALVGHGELDQVLVRRLAVTLYVAYVQHGRFYVLHAGMQERDVIGVADELRTHLQRLARLVESELRYETHSAHVKGAFSGNAAFTALFNELHSASGGTTATAEGGYQRLYEAARLALRPTYYHQALLAPLDSAAFQEHRYRVVLVGGDEIVGGEAADMPVEDQLDVALAQRAMSVEAFQRLQLQSPLFWRLVRAGNALVRIDATGRVAPLETEAERLRAVYDVLI